MPDRGLSPVVGTVLLVAIVVALAGTLAAGIQAAQPEPQPTVVITGEANASADRITLSHVSGDPIPVESLRVSVRVDGQPLEQQPPVPFFAAQGFRSGPTGPFNVASEHTWSAGETASFRIASTNTPTLSSGSTVTVRLCLDSGCPETIRTTAT